MSELLHRFKICPTDAECWFDVLVFSDTDSLNVYADADEPIDAAFIPLDPTSSIDVSVEAAIDGLADKIAQAEDSLRRICDVAGVRYFGGAITVLKEKGCAGQFIFSADHMNPGTMAHEAAHSVFWLNYLKKGTRSLRLGNGRIANKSEEDFAHLIGEITDALWNGCRKVMMAGLMAA